MFDKPKPVLPGAPKTSSDNQPEDMFDAVESKTPKSSPTTTLPTNPPAASPSSDSGVLMTESPQRKSGLIFKITISILIIIILGLLGLIGYSYFFSAKSSFDELEGYNNIETADIGPNAAVVEEEPTKAEPEAKKTLEATKAEPEAKKTLEEQEVLPEERDSDSDGLTDDEERTLKTNPRNHDSDSDHLFDFDEVYVYATDPLNPDTDGDGFLDGEEVKNGYNPKGAGKLFDVPK